MKRLDLSKRPLLPPGCEWGARKGEYKRAGLSILLFSGDKGAAEDAWTEFTNFTGITKEKWMCMEQDHDAMDLLRMHCNDLEVFVGTDKDTGETYWSIGAPAGDFTSDWHEDPAEAFMSLLDKDEIFSSDEEE